MLGILRKRVVLVSILALSILVLAILTFWYRPRQATPVPFGMRFPPIDDVCKYSVITLWRNNLLDRERKFLPHFLDRAQSCGTRVVVRLHGKSSDILHDDDIGIDLSKFEDRVNDFAGFLEPYISAGVILTHLTIDEPHDCWNDWGGKCPTLEEIEEASIISKKYWPTLPTMINTIPRFAGRYTWRDTDFINFQYAFHKGDLETFIADGLVMVKTNKIRDISWSFQVATGGCDTYGACAMTPYQVRQVGTSLCATHTGLFVGFSSYRSDLMTPEMIAVIDDVRNACGIRVFNNL